MPQELTPEDEKRLKSLANTGGYVPIKMPEVSPEKQVQPGFLERFGGAAASPVAAFGEGIESAGKPGYYGVQAGMTAAENWARHRDALRAILAASPVGAISEDIYEKNWPGLAGTGTGLALSGAALGTPEGRGAIGGAFEKGLGLEEFHTPFRAGSMKVPLPRFLTRGLSGGGAGWVAGHELGVPGHLPGQIGFGLGAVEPFIEGGIEGARSAYRARPVPDPYAEAGTTRTPYIPPKRGSSEYRNPPSGSVVSGNTYETPTDEPSPLDKLSSSYRRQLAERGQPRPNLPPSTSGSINLQKMIQATKDMLKRRSQD